MEKYIIKNKLNSQITIQTIEGLNVPAESVFFLPPYSLKYIQLTQDQISYVKANYGSDLIIKKSN